MRVEVGARRRQRLRPARPRPALRGLCDAQSTSLGAGCNASPNDRGISLCARYSLPRKFESCIDGREPHMRTYQKHTVLSMMSFLPRASLPTPSGCTEFARKPLIFHELAPDIERIPCDLPAGREFRDALVPRPDFTVPSLNPRRRPSPALPSAYGPLARIACAVSSPLASAA